MADFLESLKKLETDPSVLHRAVVAEEANARQGTQSAKTRSEVRGGGKKPYKQKKTGNARQGTIRAPHYAHGGMALAVKPRDYSKKLNKKERKLATLAALSAKVTGDALVTVDKIKFDAPKTKSAQDLLAKAGLADCPRVLVVLEAVDDNTYRSFRNLPNVVVKVAPNSEGKGEVFSVRDLVVAHKVLTTKGALKLIEAAFNKKEASK